MIRLLRAAIDRAIDALTQLDVLLESVSGDDPEWPITGGYCVPDDWRDARG